MIKFLKSNSYTNQYYTWYNKSQERKVIAMKYLCTFGSGWDKAIKKVFKKEFTNYHIEFISDGIIIFNSTELIDTKKMFFSITSIYY